MVGKLAMTAVLAASMWALLDPQGCAGSAATGRLLGRTEVWDYAPAMREVATRFTGREGVVLHLGDSITYASPYTAWARNGAGKTPEEEAILRWSHCGEQNDLDGWHLASHDVAFCRSFTAACGVASEEYIAGGKNGLPPFEEIVQTYNPQIVVLMLGTNDAWQERTVEDFAGAMETIVARLLANGTIVVLSTIPPMILNPELAQQCNEELWRLAERHRLPVIDYYGEIVARRPGMSWDGTLMERGDPHPTASRAGVTPESHPTPENLCESGYLLRGWLTVRKLVEVKARVLDCAND